MAASSGLGGRQGIGLFQAAGRPVMIGVSLNTPGALRVAADPVVLEPGDMPDFPAGWIELGRIGDHQVLSQAVGVGGQQAEGAPMTVAQGLGKKGAAANSGGHGFGSVHGEASVQA